MDPVVLIVVVGLLLALISALWIIRLRNDELDALRLASRAPGAPTVSSTGSPATERPEPIEDLLPLGVIHLDAGHRVERANPRAHAMLGVAPGRLVGRTVMEAFLDTRIEALIEGVPEGGSATGEMLAGGGQPVPSDGERRVLVVRANRASGSDPVVLLEDVTELRRLEQIRSEFIDNVSHELRTPLSTVLLLAETLARDADGADVPPRMKERIAKVEVETGHLVQMVNELLDLARIEGGTQLSLMDDVDLGRLAEASVERLRLFADRQGVNLVTDIQPDLPAVGGDEARLGQVFVNLVHNAVKFSPDGGEVRIRVRIEDGDAVSSVIDHGIGISSADQARIFERFYKADRARVRGGGTGLGLSIARHVVEGHGGRIWVESEKGRGSTFSFAIPVPSPGERQTADASPGASEGAS